MVQQTQPPSQPIATSLRLVKRLFAKSPADGCPCTRSTNSAKGRVIVQDNGESPRISLGLVTHAEKRPYVGRGSARIQPALQRTRAKRLPPQTLRAVAARPADVGVRAQTSMPWCPVSKLMTSAPRRRDRWDWLALRREGRGEDGNGDRPAEESYGPRFRRRQDICAEREEPTATCRNRWACTGPRCKRGLQWRVPSESVRGVVRRNREQRDESPT